ncbi:hypothetical protein F4821DRAFT_130935 [Hypoxylon rubiginosum]|uniref:Uncharacterized protein n=1 Tax=Hypoxylon rubiginosum TaxID=110542 RepID=A0ACC0D120_9PEZI|nr:hypothetical protein F4821DRAFT_130935 [Hypoxylon rubiginosum]
MHLHGKWLMSFNCNGIGMQKVKLNSTKMLRPPRDSNPQPQSFTPIIMDDNRRTARYHCAKQSVSFE